MKILFLSIAVFVALATSDCIKENKACKGKRGKKYSDVESDLECSGYCKKGCGYWSWSSSSKTCYTYKACKYYSKTGYFSGPVGCPPEQTVQNVSPPFCPFCPPFLPFCAFGVCSALERRCTGRCVPFDISNEDLCSEKLALSYLEECADSCASGDDECETCVSNSIDQHNCRAYLSSDCGSIEKAKCVIAIPLAIKDCLSKFPPTKEPEKFVSCIVEEVSKKCSKTCACSLLCPRVKKLLGVSEDTCLAICNDSKYWCYEGSCGPDNWPTLFPDFCNGKKQSPIDIVFNGSTKKEPSPLTFTNYNNVRTLVLDNAEEQYDPVLTNSGAEGHRGFYLHGGGNWGRSHRQKRQTSILFNYNGHTAQVSVEANAGDGVLSGGPLSGKYHILQFHFHWGKDSTKGSEHTINGKKYPLELHIVHSKEGVEDRLNTEKGLAVTGFMFEIDSADNTALTPLTDALKNVINSDAEMPFQSCGFRIDQLIAGVAPIGNAVTPYSHYEGSLTTPTCNEVVEWINFLTPLNISESQLNMFRAMMDSKGKNIVNNFRPPQPLNGRKVEFYG